MNAKKFSTNGLDINYYYQSSGKPRVWLIHGLTDSGLCWDRVADALIKEYDVVIPDLRGHGNSSKPKTGYTYSDFVSDMSNLLRALKQSNITIIGHSIGADIAMLLAENNKEKICGIVLEDPPWDDPIRTKKEKRLEARELRNELLQFTDLSLSELEDYYKNVTPNANIIDAQTWAYSQKSVSLSVVEWVTSEPTNWKKSLPNTNCDILLLTGENKLGAYVTPSLANQAKLLWSKGRHVKYDDTGHTIHREQFELFMKDINLFLNSVYKS